MLPNSRTLAIAAMTALVGACSDTTPPVFCPDILKWSLEVSVFDAATGAPAATGATVVVQSAVFQDSVVLVGEATPPLAPYMVTEDRAKAGTYSVTVRKTGYRDWQVNDVIIRAGRCGVAGPTLLTANLQR